MMKIEDDRLSSQITVIEACNLHQIEGHESFNNCLQVEFATLCKYNELAEEKNNSSGNLLWQTTEVLKLVKCEIWLIEILM